MAISLGFGVLFATFITLVTVPANYLILEDIRRLFRRTMGRSDESGNPTTEAAVESLTP